MDTATQEQRIITEQQRKLAEDQRTLAEQSCRSRRGSNLRMNAAGGASLPPELSLRLREIDMKREVCARSNCTFRFGGAPTPVVNVARQVLQHAVYEEERLANGHQPLRRAGVRANRQPWK